MRALLSLTKANIQSFVRDRNSVFWTLAFPVLFIVLFGAIFSGGGTATYKVGWVDGDTGAAAARLRAAFASVPLLSLRDETQSAALADMRKGDLSAVVVVPPGLSRAMASYGAASSQSAAPAIQLQVYTDPSQQTTSQTIRQIVVQVVESTNLALTGRLPLLSVDERTLQTQQLTNAAFLVPGILGMALMQLGLFAAVPLVSQREKLILKRLGATPLNRGTFVGSQVLLRLLIAIVQTVLILGIGMSVFGVRILGDFALMVSLVLLGAATFIAIGYVIASFARTEDAASGIVQAIQFPMMFLSGVFFPLEIMPNVLRPVATILPLTYLGDALRQVMVGGTPFAPLGLDFAVLVGWLVVCLAISARFFRWE